MRLLHILGTYHKLSVILKVAMLSQDVSSVDIDDSALDSDRIMVQHNISSPKTKRTDAMAALPLGMTGTNRSVGRGVGMDTPHPSPDNNADYPTPSQPYVPEHRFDKTITVRGDKSATDRIVEKESPRYDPKIISMEEYPIRKSLLKSPTIDSDNDIEPTINNSQEISNQAKKVDPKVYIVVNQKAASKKRLISDLDLVIYIDCARFLPDNINLSKIKVSFYNRDGKLIGNEPEYTKMLSTDSDIYSPTFNMKIQLNKDDYDMAEGMWMVCSLYTLEVSVQEDMNTTVFFAYSMFPLAVTEKEAKDPFIWGFNRLVLNHGAFQLPLYSPRQSRDTLEETILAIEYK
jgi:hypothetical protein